MKINIFALCFSSVEALRAKQRKRNAELRSGLSSKSAEGSDDGLPKEEGEYSSSGGASEDENERKESPQPKTISKGKKSRGHGCWCSLGPLLMI